jgi:hypothetical protein
MSETLSSGSSPSYFIIYMADSEDLSDITLETKKYSNIDGVRGFIEGRRLKENEYLVMSGVIVKDV